MKYLFCFLFVMVISGCSQPSEFEAIGEFRRKHPEDAKMYVHIYPVDLNILREMLGGRAASLDDLARELKQKFDDVQGLKEFVEHKEREDRKEREAQYKEYHELERISGNGGLICQYEWKGNEELKMGLLVLKNGDIIKRDEWSSKIVDPAIVKRINE